MYIFISDVGGSEFAFRQAPPVTGKSFRVVRARGECRVEMHLKCHPRRVSFSLCARGPFPFPL